MWCWDKSLKTSYRYIVLLYNLYRTAVKQYCTFFGYLWQQPGTTCLGYLWGATTCRIYFTKNSFETCIYWTVVLVHIVFFGFRWKAGGALQRSSINGMYFVFQIICCWGQGLQCSYLWPCATSVWFWISRSCWRGHLECLGTNTTLSLPRAWGSNVFGLVIYRFFKLKNFLDYYIVFCLSFSDRSVQLYNIIFVILFSFLGCVR